MGKNGRALSYSAVMVLALAAGTVVIAVTAGPVAACIWFLVIVCFFRHIRKRLAKIGEFDKKLDLLTKECDPAGYIQAVAEWVNANPKSAVKQEVIRANLAVAYFDSGQYQAACDMLEDVYRKTGKKDSLQVRAVACNNLAVFYFRMNEEEKFDFYFNQLPQLGEKLKKDAAVSSMISQSIKDLEMQMEIKQGRVIQALDYYKERFQKMPYGNTGVNSQYWLFRIYEITGDVEGQKNAMNYISSHGGTTIYAADAREWLRNREAKEK